MQFAQVAQELQARLGAAAEGFGGLLAQGGEGTGRRVVPRAVEVEPVVAGCSAKYPAPPSTSGTLSSETPAYVW